MEEGILYGVGVGPGDPELLTLKAVKYIKQCDICFCPGESPREAVAYKIALGAVPELEEKNVCGLPMPMTKNKDILEISHKKAVLKVKEALDDGKKVVFLTLGDISIYSTFGYIAEPLMKDGYQVEMIPGIPSFVATAAKGNIALACREEEIHVVPATYRCETLPNYAGTTIYMKAGKKMKEIKALEKDREMIFAENVGMEDERILEKRDDFPDEAGYYTLVICK